MITPTTSSIHPQCPFSWFIWSALPRSGPVRAEALALCGALYILRIFAIGAGYHRYFAHRAFKTSRVVQFLLAFFGPNLRPAGGALVGGQTSAPSQPFGYRTRRALAASARLPLCAPRLDLHPAAWGHRLRCDGRFRALSGARVARSASLPAGDPARPSGVADCRLAGPGSRLLLEYRAALARHLRDQLAGSRRRAPALRDRR